MGEGEREGERELRRQGMDKEETHSKFRMKINEPQTK